jgi:hypothetical protein|nr:MAG TPA: hypothetical protein [Caudoviricetes sp.]
MKAKLLKLLRTNLEFYYLRGADKYFVFDKETKECKWGKSVSEIISQTAKMDRFTEMLGTKVLLLLESAVQRREVIEDYKRYNSIYKQIRKGIEEEVRKDLKENKSNTNNYVVL